MSGQENPAGSPKKKTSSAERQTSGAETIIQEMPSHGDEFGQNHITNELMNAEALNTAKSKSASTPRRRRTSNRRHKGTILKFATLEDRPNVARLQMLLCNISDRALYFKLKCSMGSNVSALPAGSGHIAAKSQARIVLTWHMPKSATCWEEAPTPKMLLVTRFLDATNSEDAQASSTRLEGRINEESTCNASNPPVEQLILDAVSKNDGNHHVEQHGARQVDQRSLYDVLRDAFCQLSPEWQMATLVAIFLIVYSLLRPLIAEPTPVIIRSK